MVIKKNSNLIILLLIILLFPLTIAGKTLVLLDLMVVVFYFYILKINNYKIKVKNTKLFITLILILAFVSLVKTEINIYNIKLLLTIMEILLVYNLLKLNKFDKQDPLRAFYYVSIIIIGLSILQYIMGDINISQLKAFISMSLLYIFFYYILINKLTIINFVVLFLSFYILQTRSALIILFLYIFIFFIKKLEIKRFKLYITSIAFFSFFILFSIIDVEQKINNLHDSTLSNMQRIELIEVSINSIVMHPFIPRGLDGWRQDLKNTTRFSSNKKSNIAPHNMFLSLGLMLGIIPLFILLFMLIKFIYVSTDPILFFIKISLVFIVALSPFEGGLRLMVIILISYMLFSENMEKLKNA